MKAFSIVYCLYMTFSFLGILAGIAVIVFGALLILAGAYQLGVVLVLVGIGGLWRFAMYRDMLRRAREIL